MSVSAPTLERLRRVTESIAELAASWAPVRQYMAPILFLRFLSEWQENTRAQYQRKYKGHPLRVGRAMARERFIVPEHCTFAHIFAERSPKDLGEKLDQAFRALELANAGKLAGVFTSTTFATTEPGKPEHNAKLLQLLELVAEIEVDPHETPGTEWMGALYELLISRFAEDAARRRAPYYTPRATAELITRLVTPRSNERIYDPACGSGGLLIHASRAIDDGNFALYGHEPNRDTWALARANLILQNLDSGRIADSDAIRAPFKGSDDRLQTFDVIISDPPFSLDWDADSAKHDSTNRFRRGIPAKSSGDYALISHIAEALHPKNGRACIVVPLGTLFRGGSEKLIRARLIEEGLLDGVVRLPANLFYGTAIPAALLMFRTARAEQEPLFFIDASRDYSSDRNRNTLREEHIDKIVSCWKSRSEIPSYSRLVDRQEIERNDFNLKVSLYIKTPHEEFDLDEATESVDRLERLLSQARSDLAAALNRLGE